MKGLIAQWGGAMLRLLIQNDRIAASQNPLYWSFYRFGGPKLLPFSIVISISFRCNSKCRTCDVAQAE
jgi:hypothetical protein